MRKKMIPVFFVVAMALVFAMPIGSAFATGETATATNMQIAEGKAAEIDTLVTVLWAYWMDELNAYNLHPDTEDPPQWTEDFNDLTDLPDTFPVEDYELHINGNNIDIHTTISEGLVEYLRVLLPLAAISDTGDVVLTVVRPRAYLGSSIFVKRDGTTEDGGPTFMPNHTISFGQDINLSFEGDAVFNVPSGYSLGFSGGTLTDIGGLAYRGQELDDRFVNVSGDNIAGTLTIQGNKVWHAGNDGTGSGLDADLLDGKDSAFFTNASNLNAGVVPIGRLSGTYNINVTGTADYADRAGHATTADSASSATYLGGRDKSAWETYINNAAKSAAESPLVLTGTWYVNNVRNASGMYGAIAGGGPGVTYYYNPNRNGRWYSISSLRRSDFFPSIPTTIDSSVTSNIHGVTVTIRLGATWDSGSVARVYRRKIGDSSGGVLIVNKSISRGGSWRSAYASFTVEPGYEYRFDCYMERRCGESYDDGYGMAMYATKVVMGAKFK